MSKQIEKPEKKIEKPEKQASISDEDLDGVAGGFVLDQPGDTSIFGERGDAPVNVSQPRDKFKHRS